MASYFKRKIAQTVTQVLKGSLPVAATQVATLVKPMPNFHNNKDQVILTFQNFFPSHWKHEAEKTLKTISQETEEFTFIGTDGTLKDSLLFAVPFRNFSKKLVDTITHSPCSFLKESFCDVQKQKIVVEFSSPNLAKPFHFGHFRSTVLGNFIANIHETLGHEVVRLNFLGDWGTQYGLLGVGLNMAELKEELNGNSINHLFQVYVHMNLLAETNPDIKTKARDFFSRMEKGDAEVLQQWDEIRQLSIQDLQKTYKRLGIHFDEFHGESMYNQMSAEVIKNCYEQGITVEYDDALAVEVAFGSQRRNVILQKNDGSSVYLTRLKSVVEF